MFIVKEANGLLIKLFYVELDEAFPTVTNFRQYFVVVS